MTRDLGGAGPSPHHPYQFTAFSSPFVADALPNLAPNDMSKYGRPFNRKRRGLGTLPPHFIQARSPWLAEGKCRGAVRWRGRGACSSSSPKGRCSGVEGKLQLQQLRLGISCRHKAKKLSCSACTEPRLESHGMTAIATLQSSPRCIYEGKLMSLFFPWGLPACSMNPANQGQAAS